MPGNKMDDAYNTSEKKNANSNPANHRGDERMVSVAGWHLRRRVLVWNTREYGVIDESAHEKTPAYRYK